MAKKRVGVFEGGGWYPNAHYAAKAHFLNIIHFKAQLFSILWWRFYTAVDYLFLDSLTGKISRNLVILITSEISPPSTRLHTMRTERQRMLIQLILTLATFIDTPGLRSPIFFSLCNFFLFVLFFLWFHWKRQICYMSINLVCSARPKKIKLPAWSEQQTEELHRIYDEMKTTIGNLYLYWFYK